MRGWIEDWSARSARDEALRRLLIGDVASVRYVEIDYAAGADNGSMSTPAWLGGAFDSIDYGVEVDYEDGRQVVVTWETPSWDEGMVLTEGTLQPDHVGLQADVCAWDVGERWQRRGGRRVVDVRSFWSRASYGPGVNGAGEVVSAARVSHYQLDGISIRWETGRRFVLVLGERDEETGGFRHQPDNVVVFYSEEEARRAGMGLVDMIDVTT